MKRSWPHSASKVNCTPIILHKPARYENFLLEGHAAVAESAAAFFHAVLTGYTATAAAVIAYIAACTIEAVVPSDFAIALGRQKEVDLKITLTLKCD